MSTPARSGVGGGTSAMRTPSLQSAFDAARYYLGTGAVSKSALLQSMATNGFETYSEAEALYAVNHLGVDWRAKAVERAKIYDSPLSPKRLFENLAEGDGFSKTEARYAVSHAARDWNAEAVAEAKSRLDGDAVSKSQLIKDLKLAGFTDAQVRYAVEKVH